MTCSTCPHHHIGLPGQHLCGKYQIQIAAVDLDKPRGCEETRKRLVTRYER
jgi:hypothetical protein